MASLKTRLTRYARKRGERGRNLARGIRKATRPKTTKAREQLASGLRADSSLQIDPSQGFRILGDGTFSEAAEIADAARKQTEGVDLAEKMAEAERSYLVPIVGEQDLTRDSPLIRLALRPDLIAAVTDYLGVMPVLSSAGFFWSKETMDKPRGTQRLHCDAEDTTQVKAWVLCSDVKAENGPLTILDARTSEELRRKTGYKYYESLTDYEAEEAIADFDAKLQAFTGPPGKTCLVDTSRCFHYGSRVDVDAEPRLAAMIQFMTPYSFMVPRNFPEVLPFARLARPDDDQNVRLVLGAE